MNKKIISIIIPAYNIPDYTAKTLKSIAEQTYRPLRVILLDDCSPISLAPLAEIYQNVFKIEGIEFSYVRNEINLGVDNTIKMHSLLGDGWGIVVHHDDWLIDPTFLSSCMEILEKNSDNEIQLFYANTITEKSKIRMVDSFDESWSLIPGSDFIPYILNKGFTAWSAILFNNAILKDIGWPNELFYVNKQTAKLLDLNSDDGFSGFYLLAMHGNCCVTGRLVSVRGEPDSAYSKSSSWSKVGNSLFYIYYNLYKYKSSSIYAKKINQQALASAYYWSFTREEGINEKLLNHFSSTHMKFHYFSAYLSSKLGINRLISQVWSLITIRNYFRAFCIAIFIPFELLRKVLLNTTKNLIRTQVKITPIMVTIATFKALSWYAKLLQTKIAESTNGKPTNGNEN
jgi:glycosyltransferase involved in cell wall biosynthesis